MMYKFWLSKSDREELDRRRKAEAAKEDLENLIPVLQSLFQHSSDNGASYAVWKESEVRKLLIDIVKNPNVNQTFCISRHLGERR